MELELNESLRGVRNPTHRAILWPSCRSLTDGRRVGLGDVIRYEMVAGVTMLAFGPHRAQWHPRRRACPVR